MIVKADVRQLRFFQQCFVFALLQIRRRDRFSDGIHEDKLLRFGRPAFGLHALFVIAKMLDCREIEVYAPDAGFRLGAQRRARARVQSPLNNDVIGVHLPPA